MSKTLEYMTEPEINALMQRCARAVELAFTAEDMTEKPQFALLVFNDPKRSQYVANCEREDMVDALREATDRMAGSDRPPDQMVRPAIALLKELGYRWDEGLRKWRRNR